MRRRGSISWKEYVSDDTQRDPRVIVGAGVVVILVVIIIGTVALFSTGSAKFNNASPTTLFAPTNTTVDPRQSTTVQTFAAPRDDRKDSVEGAINTAADLSAVYNADTSGLTPDMYARATNQGRAIVTARATGAGADAFKAYIAQGTGILSMKTFSIDYATAMTVPGNPNLIRTAVWWKGTRTLGTVVPQARTVTYVYADTLAPLTSAEVPAALKRDDGTNYIE